MYMCLPPDPNEESGLQQHGRARFEIFTRGQREAIAAYLREWAISDSPFVEAHADDIPRAIERLLDHDMAA